jgi:hypothetical protein
MLPNQSLQRTRRKRRAAELGRWAAVADVGQQWQTARDRMR